MITKKRLTRKTGFKHHVKGTKQGHLIAPVSKKRYQGLREYAKARQRFLREHPICPVTGKGTTEIHHSAGRTANWLTLERYWVALSREGHAFVHSHPIWAKAWCLTVTIHADYDTHVGILENAGESLTDPVFYTYWHGDKLPGLR